MTDIKVKVERVQLSTSLTALKSLDSSNILIGMGGEVRLLSQASNNSWASKVRHQVFSNQNVHGLVTCSKSSRKILAFGGRQYALIEVCMEQTQSHIESRWRHFCEDWILDGHWLDEKRLALLTAHGKLQEISTESGHSLRSAVCPDRSILYSGRIIGSPNWNDLVVLGGTVHNQINVWSPHGSDSLSTTLVTLSGHKGVIFSVRYDKESNRICSTSDDRTARIWRVVFGEERLSSEVERWSKAEFSLVLTLFGHKARVWDSVFLTHALLATIAEDGGVMVWSEKGECLMQSWVQGGLLCLDLVPSGMFSSLRHKPPSGDSINCQSSSLILTAGGTDGSLYLFPVTLPQPSLTSLPLTENVPRQVCLSSNNDVITYTEGGHILMNSGIDGWVQCFSSENISSYCILSMSPCRNYLAAADIIGSVYLFSVSDRKLELLIGEKVMDGRVFSLHWLAQDSLLVCGPHGILKLLRTDINVTDGGFCVGGSLELPESKERWTTCCIMVKDKFLICGDRMGSLHLYLLLSQEKPVLSLNKVHGSRGVSCIQSVHMSTNNEERLVSCGRDGTLRQYRLTLSDSPSMEPLLCLRLSMDWASHIISSPSFGQLIIGFHNVYFCVWSLRETRYLLKLKCWGGHRSWDLHLNSEEALQLVFIKDKSVHYLSTPLHCLALPPPLIGLHSKTVNGCCWVNEYGLIVSGSEDTSVRVCHQTGGELEAVCCVESHVSSVRALAHLSLPHSTPLTLVVTAGGRAQLKLWTLSPSGELCERGSHMLRREEDLLRDWRSEKALDEPEVRYMDLSLVQSSPQSAFIYTVASDGIFRVFEVNLCEFSLKEVVCEDSEAGRCFLRVRTLRLNEDLVLAITGSTHGHLILWTHSLPQGEMKAVKKVKRHSGGINSLSLRFFKDVAKGGSILVASGGDDSTVVLSLFNLGSSLTLRETLISKLDTLHTCQVTGLEVLDNYLISGGLDGRLCLVKWDLRGNLLERNHLMTFASSLSDIHGLVAHIKQQELSVCVYGIGLEVLRISLHPD